MPFLFSVVTIIMTHYTGGKLQMCLACFYPYKFEHYGTVHHVLQDGSVIHGFGPYFNYCVTQFFCGVEWWRVGVRAPLQQGTVPREGVSARR
jgi:hypothetical protein